MEDKICPECGGTKFAEGSDYVQIRPTRFSWRGSIKIYEFCLRCGKVYSIRIENPEIFNKKK
jgi:ribosomal protein S27AE